jgi:hypothetical protein
MRLRTWLDGAIGGVYNYLYAYDPQLQDTLTGFAPPEKVKAVALLTQGILEIVTCNDLPGVRVLPVELKETPLILLLADQVRLPCEFEVSATVTLQDQVLLA